MSFISPTDKWTEPFLHKFSEEKEEVQTIQKVKTLLDVDVKKVLEKVEKKYGLKLPRKVVAIDYGDDVGDLFIRFEHAKQTEGEPTEDGQIIVHYDREERIAAIEIMDITAL